MIYKKVLFLFILTAVAVNITAQSISNIIPMPVRVEKLPSSKVKLTTNSVIYFSPLFEAQAQYFRELLAKQTGILLMGKAHNSSGSSSLQNAVLLQQDSTNIDRPEMYRITIRDGIVRMQARDVRGVINAVQTFLQLAPLKKTSTFLLPAVIITDYPRFTYRGMHLDVVRHFFPVSYIKKYLDYLAFHKLNTFHWHLTDDQGWRLPSKRYPLLNTIGSWRDSALIGHFKDTPARYDGQRYGGFYSKAEIDDVLAYAKVLGITVIPEVDIPGHARAIIAAYPGLSTRPDTTWQVATTWGMYNRQNNVLAPNDSTFTFLQNIFSELCELFPSTYIHIGGDESSYLWWKRDPKTQAFIQGKGLKNEAALLTYFSNYVAGILREKGRKTMGWHEIGEGDIDTSAILMHWADDVKALEIARKGFSVVMTPGKPFYGAA